MAVEHKDLTGTQLHEPKGASTATAGSVYVANGSGSGAWSPLTGTIYNVNRFAVASTMTDIGDTKSVYFNVPVKSTLVRLNALLYDTLAGATNEVLTIYIDNVLFADSLTITNAGTAEGQKKSLLITTGNTVNAGSIIKVTSNGGPTNSSRADIQLELQAVA